MRILCVVIGISFFLGCQDTPKPPNWYYQSQSDKDNLYGVASDKNLQSAKDNAITDMLSHLQVNVSSSTSLSQKYSDGIESSDMSQVIQKNITQTTLSNVSYQTERVGNAYFVRAIVKKQDFITQLKKEQESALNALQSLNLTCQDITLKEYNTLVQELGKALGAQNYLDALGVSSNASALLYANILESNSPKPRITLVFENPTQEGVSALTTHLQKELVKFYRLDSQASQQFRISFTMPNTTNIKANITITDCKGNPTFATQISESLPDNTDVDKLANRTGVLIYKKLLEYAQ
ncbi:LPP20 family lipoprotein [uncultured Helicobacter sp.]|uniref:LPP20 family lipoprotein n=1 Tax=uncultured Helicobacter sp. TaxID=175537 RepID=UPI00374EF300